MNTISLQQLQDLERLMILWYGANHKELTAEQKKAYLTSHAIVETSLIAKKIQQGNIGQAVHQPRK